MTELCEILSRVSGMTFRTHAAATYREMARSVESGEVMVAWAPPVLALDLDERSIATPIALPIRSGMSTYNTALIVRERIPGKIEELRGARMAWVDRESSSGYIVPRIHLASLGCDLDHFFAQETFHSTHIGVVDAVASGRADVGATFYVAEGTGKIASAGWTTNDGSTIRSVKVAVTAGPIPNDLIVVARSLPVTVRSAIQRWLLDLDDRSKELFSEVIHSKEFRVPSAAHFQPLRAMLAAGRARGVAL
jgi:ABC-type phosphate/phosphonate transport system substrate-binding protein